MRLGVEAYRQSSGMHFAAWLALQSEMELSTWIATDAVGFTESAVQPLRDAYDMCGLGEIHLFFAEHR